MIKGHAKIKESRIKKKLPFLFLGLSLLCWSGPHQKNRNGVTQETFTREGNTLRDLLEGMAYVTVGSSQAGPKSHRAALGQTNWNCQVLAEPWGLR